MQWLYLVGKGEPYMHHELIHQLHTAEVWQARFMAAAALGGIAHMPDVTVSVECALLRAFRTERQRPVRIAVIVALSKLGTEKALQALTDTVLDDEDPQAVQLALHLLKKLDQPAVVREFVNILQDLATSPAERVKAACALGVLGGDERLIPPALLEATMRAPSAQVRTAAVTALSAYREEAVLLRKPGGISALRMELKTLVMVAIDDEDEQVRVAAAQALGRMAAATAPRRGCLTWLRAMLDRPGTAEVWQRVVRQFELSKIG
jgi:HEAT repeat protein